MNSQVFREYDIRGIVATDFDDAFVVDLGRGYATLLHRAGKKTVTLGRDCRLSSDRLRDRLAEGLLATCLQHELDHLNGVLFVDHLSTLKRDMLLRKLKKYTKENIEEMAESHVLL